MVLLGLGLVLAGTGFLFVWHERRAVRRSRAVQTPWSRRGTALAGIGGTLFLAAGVTAIVVGVEALADHS